MDSRELDRMVMSTLETFDNPIIDNYDPDVIEELEQNYVEGGGNEVEHSLWDYPPFNDVSGWMDVDPLDEYYFDNSRFDMNSLHKGMSFKSKDDVIHACQGYSIKNRVEYCTVSSDTKRLILDCKEKNNNCQWHLRASKASEASIWIITRYVGPHTCMSDIIVKDNPHLTKDFIAREIVDLIREKLRFSAGQIKGIIGKTFGYDIPYMKAWLARQAALKIIFGDWKESFAQLPAYMSALEKYNPGTVVYWNKTTVDDNTVAVDRIFWAFGPSIQAFTHCRPVISVDGTHMYGKYKGTLLVALSLDANNHVIPLAFALVESENNDSWEWFMSCIRQGVTQRDGLGIISDRHAGIISAMNDPEWREPIAYHRFCNRHFVSNFNTKVKSKVLKKLLKTTSHMNQLKKFDKLYGDLKEALKDKNDALQWLDRVPKEKWAFAHDIGGRRWDSMTTNASESFNNILKHSRDLPITTLVHFTFKQVNGYFCERRDQYQDYTREFSPRIQDLLDNKAEKARGHRVEMFDRRKGIARVTTAKKHNVHIVKIHERTCSCGKWQLKHYPCSHVLAVTEHEHLNYGQFVASEYSMAAYNDTWKYTFHPLPDSAYWPTYEGPRHIPNPHFKRKKKGRHPSKRKHGEMDFGDSQRYQSEDPNVASTSQDPNITASSQGDAPTTSKRVVKCSKCRCVGHNKKTCPQ